jgi:hypothetical protein
MMRAARRPYFRDRWRWPRWMTRTDNHWCDLVMWSWSRRRAP